MPRSPGKASWFQLHPSLTADIQADILEQVKNAGVETLGRIVDAPVVSCRERQARLGLGSPP
ncbi:MAG: hypothetical protein DWQ09_02115 [Proteobacteria bacterium]|nr:MAG: hypothetical protein DWQ09_02115 [Pseudomonadota bacterium]QKK11778.1 MAG: hypothetical protein HND59_09455 [Pseudomonadota bacterium]